MKKEFIIRVVFENWEVFGRISEDDYTERIEKITIELDNILGKNNIVYDMMDWDSSYVGMSNAVHDVGFKIETALFIEEIEDLFKEYQIKYQDQNEYPVYVTIEEVED